MELMQRTLGKAAMGVVAAGAGHIAARLHAGQGVATAFIEGGKLFQVASTTGADLQLRIGDRIPGHVNLVAIGTGQAFNIVSIEVPGAVTFAQMAAQAN